jgi:hypothetical protein
LPNYVAVKLLAKPNTHIYIVHTRETEAIATRLVEVLSLRDGQWTKIETDEADAYQIFEQVYKYATK